MRNGIRLAFLCSLAIFFILSQGPAAAQALAVSTISGTVTTADDGSPIMGANIHYRRVPRLVSAGHTPKVAPGESLVSSTVVTDVKGAFAAPNLPAGDYIVCADVPSQPYLDPCRWSSTPRLTVSSGIPALQPLVLKKGVYLNVRVNDPKGLLPPFLNGPLRAANLIVGVVFGNGAFLGAANTSIDSAGRDFQMAIPAGVPLKVWLFSRHVTLTDFSGKAVVSTGTSIPFQATSGQDYAITVNVTGLVQ